MELIVEITYAADRYRLFLPSVSKRHTVSEIVHSVQTRRSQQAVVPLVEKYTFIFKWKHSERICHRIESKREFFRIFYFFRNFSFKPCVVPPNERPLKLAEMFRPGDTSFIIRITKPEKLIEQKTAGPQRSIHSRSSSSSKKSKEFRL